MKKLFCLLVIIVTFSFGSSLIKAQSITLAELAEELKNGEIYNEYINFGGTINIILNAQNLNVEMIRETENYTLTFNFSDNIISLAYTDVVTAKEIYDGADYDLLTAYYAWFFEILFASGRLVDMSKEDCQNFMNDGEGGLKELSLVNDGLELDQEEYTFIYNPGDEPITQTMISSYNFDLDNPFGQGTPYAPPTPEPDSEPESEIIPEAEPRPALPPNPDTGRESSRYFIISGLTAITLINLAIHKRRNLFKI